jgi:DnaJ-class molecular chaperone
MQRITETFYQVLGVPPSATAQQVHAAYLALTRRLHPDVGGDDEQFKRVTLAYGTLKNEELRKVYNTRLRLECGICASCNGAGTTTYQKTFTTKEHRTCKACNGVGFFPKQR